MNDLMVGQDVGSLMIDSQRTELLFKQAELMAKSKVTIPKHLQGNPGDCYAIILQALQWRLNPFVVAQKTHIINGVLCYESQLINGVIQSMGAIKGGFKYEYKGEGVDISCRVGAVIAGDDEITWGEYLSTKDVTTKNSPLWKTNPKQQLSYLQVKNWARLYCPAAILGLSAPDDFNDSTSKTERDITPPRYENEIIEGNLLPDCDDDRLISNLPDYEQMIEGGNVTAQGIIDSLSKKMNLSKEQKELILSLA